MPTKVVSAELIALEVEVDLALFDLWLAEMLEDPTYLTGTSKLHVSENGFAETRECSSLETLGKKRLLLKESVV